MSEADVNIYEEFYANQTEALDRDCFAELGRIAAPHAQANDSPFVLIEKPDFKAHPYQRIGAVSANRNQTHGSSNEDEIWRIANQFIDNFGEGIVSPLKQTSFNGIQLVKKVEDHLERGLTVIGVTDHVQLHGVAAGYAGLLLPVNEAEPGLLTDNSRIIISAGIKALGVITPEFPAVEVTRLLGSTHFSFQRTKTMEKANIDEDVQSSINKEMRRELVHHIHRSKQRGKPGQFIFMSPSATVDKINLFSDGMHRNTMEALGHGTMRLMMQDGVLLVPMSVNLEPSAQVEPLEPRRVRSEDDCHEVMHEIAAAATGLTGVETVYAEPKSLRKKGLEIVDDLVDRMKHKTKPATG